jgi:hypothetical protein
MGIRDSKPQTFDPGLEILPLHTPLSACGCMLGQIVPSPKALNITTPGQGDAPLVVVVRAFDQIVNLSIQRSEHRRILVESPREPT